MKLASVFGIVMATWATGAAATPAPIWELFPHLVCRPENQVTCYKDTCDTKPMTGMWDLNFTKGVLTYLGGDDTESILGRTQLVAGDTASMDAFLLSSARMIVFLNTGGDPSGNVEARVVGSFGPTTRTIHMSCAVPK